MANVIKTIITFRRGTSADWEANKGVIPAAGEPCYDLTNHTLKIGDGSLTYEQLPVIGGEDEVAVSGDGKSITLENGVFKLMGFDAADIGAYPRIGEKGLEWVVPTVNVDDLKNTVTNLQTNVTNIQNTVTTIQNIVTPSGDGAVPLLDRVESIETKLDSFMETMTPDSGKVDTLLELIDYIDKHGKEAANMVTAINDLQDLVGTTSVRDQIFEIVNASGHIEEEKAKALFENVKYEISNKPEGTLVDYRDDEIRVMVPANAEFVHQNSGANADKNAYYIGFKAYAPEGAVSFKEDLAEIISDNTMYEFDGNDFAGIDKYGRKYSICWLAVAYYDDATQKWVRYAEKSTKAKYIGWYYSVEWYDANGKKIGADCIRINLSNEDCHTAVEPYYMANVVKGVSVGGNILDMIDGKVEIPMGAGLKDSDEIVVNNDGSLSVGVISFNKIEQAEEETITLDGGGAAG